MRKNPWTNTLDPNVKSKASIHVAKTIFVFYFSLPGSTNSESSTGVTCTVVPDVPRLRRKGRRDVGNQQCFFLTILLANHFVNVLFLKDCLGTGVCVAPLSPFK